MRETKGHLCTLLITFSDCDDSNKEITTAHTFASSDPAHYPQHRRVVHSRQMTEERNEGGTPPLRSELIERVSQSALSLPPGVNFGSDMVELRHVLLSSPIPRASLAPSAQQPSSAGRLINSPPGENRTEESNGRLSGHLRHLPAIGNPPTSPLASSLIGIHEVSLSYDRPELLSPSVAEERRSLPANLSSSPFRSSALPSSGSVQMHFSEGKSGGDGQLLYTVNRPQGDWTFGAGKFLQISDSFPKKSEAFPATMGGRTTTTKAPPPEDITTHPRAMDKMELTSLTRSEERQKQQPPQSRMRRSGEWEWRNCTPMFGWTSPPQVQPVPILSHHQTRSYESSEESKMSEERGTSKSRTVFEKTTCELLTEKSVTTFGRMPNAKVPTASKQSKRQKEQQPIRVVQQRQRLPRISQEELNGTYLYTRYGEEEDRRPVEVRGESAYVQQSNGDSSGREWRVTEEQSSVVQEMSRTTKSWKAPEGRVDERTTTPLVVLLSERPFRRKMPNKMPEIGEGDREKQLQRAQTTRLIDFETYKKEVEQLQRKAAATGNGNTSIELLPLAPAIVVAPGHKKEMALPKAKQPTLEATLKYFSNEELITETIKEASGNKEESEKKRRETEHKRREGEAEEEWERVEKEARDCMEERRKKRLEVEDEEKKERTRENEDKLRRMEEDKLRRMEEDKLRRMEEDELRRMEEDKLRRMEEEKLRRMEEDKLRRMEEDKLRRMEEDKLRRMEEDELRRMEEEFRKEKPSLIRPQPVYVSIASEYHHEEMDSEQRVKVMEEKGGKEPGREKEEEERNKPEGEVEKEEEQRKEQREEVIPIEFEADAGRGLGRHLLETLSRELQYQEEIDMEVSRRRRKIVADGGEEPEAEEEGRGDEHEDEEVRMGQKKEEADRRRGRRARRT